MNNWPVVVAVGGGISWGGFVFPAVTVALETLGPVTGLLQFSPSYIYYSESAARLVSELKISSYSKLISLPYYIIDSYAILAVAYRPYHPTLTAFVPPIAALSARDIKSIDPRVAYCSYC